MSEFETAPISPEPSLPPEPSPRGARARLRRFFLRHVPLAAAAAALLLALAAVVLYLAASSAAFENVVRKRLIAQVETLTGGRARDCGLSLAPASSRSGSRRHCGSRHGRPRRGALRANRSPARAGECLGLLYSPHSAAQTSRSPSPGCTSSSIPTDRLISRAHAGPEDPESPRWRRCSICKPAMSRSSRELSTTTTAPPLSTRSAGTCPSTSKPTMCRS